MFTSYQCNFTDI